MNNSVVFRPDNPLVADLHASPSSSSRNQRAGNRNDAVFRPLPSGKSIIASTAQGYVDLSSKLNYDPEQAAKLLDQAGWKLGADGQREKDGQKLVLTAYESLPQPQNKATLQLVAQQWAKLGVTLNVLAGDARQQDVERSRSGKNPGSTSDGRPRRSGRDQEQLLSEKPGRSAPEGRSRATR